MSQTSIKRLVYTPKAYAFVYSRREGRVIDVSNDITSGSIQRLINQPSKAKIHLRNDDWKYTGRFNPMFYPMDGITIWLQKFAAKPIQVFTGFIDSIPFYQAYPDKIEITATCTLKRALYSYFDPGIGFLDWLGQHGWYPQSNGNFNAFFNEDIFKTEETLAQAGGGSADGGMGQLLRDFLIDIGGYDSNSIIIGDLPSDLPKTMIQAYMKRVKASQAAENALIPTLKRFLTIQAQQGDQAAVDQLQGMPKGISAAAKPDDIKKLVGSIGRFLKSTSKPNAEQIILGAIVMSGLDNSHEGTDDKYPSHGTGFFAEPPITGRPSPASQKPNYNSPEKQGERFCQKFSEIITSPYVETRPTPSPAPLTQERAREVAEVLSYGYGKDKFYGQILEACQNAQNIQTASQIAGYIRDNQRLDNLSSLSAISAAEVTEQTLPVEITWEKIFANQINTSSSTPDAIDKDGKINGVQAIPISGQLYKSTFMTYIPGSDSISEVDFPKVEDIALKHSEIKYYVYGVANGTTGSPPKVAGRISNANLVPGSLLKLTSPDGNKSVTCVFVGNALVTSPNAPLTISSDAILALGVNKTQNKNTTAGIQFELLSSGIPSVPTTSDLGPQDLKNEYVKTLTALVGSNPSTTIGYSGVNITSADKDVYNKYYKTANNRLAEYYYIASSYGLHLVDQKPESDQLLLFGNENGSAEQMMSFLKDIGIMSPTSSSTNIVPNTVAQSVPRGLQISVDKGKTVRRFDFAGANVKSGTVISSPSNKPFVNYLAALSINANTGNPSPVWNGATARLPESAGANADSPAGGDKQTLTWSDLARISTASAFSTLTAFPFDLIGSGFLIGEKSLMNDVPIVRGIEEFCKGSMRHYMSLPNGQFCAFYPDFFGVYGRKPYLNIKDIEIIDLNIVINDEPIVTHMYVNGNTINPLQGGVDIMDKVLSVGVITIDDVFQGNGLNFINNPDAVTGANLSTPSNFQLDNAASPATFTQYYDDIDPNTVKFLETYGARPKVVNEPLIRSPWFEFVSAYNQFAYNWTMHTATNVQLTFMPELMAGGLVRFEDHNIVMYVEGVNHVWDYSTGFETSAYLTAPSTDPGDEETPTVPGLAIFRSAVGQEL